MIQRAFSVTTGSQTSHRETRAPRARQMLLRVAAVALAGWVSGCVQATAEVPEFEMTRQNVELPAAPAQTPAGTEVTAVQQFSYEKAPMSLPGSVTADMRATEVTITLRKGATDLSFVHAATLKVTHPGALTQTLIEFARDGHEKVGTEVTLPVKDSTAVSNPWTADGSVYEISLTGELPRKAWNVDISIKFSGSLTYSP